MAQNHYGLLAFLMVTFVFPTESPNRNKMQNIGQLLSMHYHHEWLDEQAEKRQARENKKVSISDIFHTIMPCL